MHIEHEMSQCVRAYCDNHSQNYYSTAKLMVDRYYNKMYNTIYVIFCIVGFAHAHQKIIINSMFTYSAAIYILSRKLSLPLLAIIFSFVALHM